MTYRHGELVKIAQDGDGNGFMETVILVKKEKPHLETHDINRDGRPDISILFDQDGRRERVESDSNQNGKPETWEYYKKGKLIRIERDEKENS